LEKKKQAEERAERLRVAAENERRAELQRQLSGLRGQVAKNLSGETEITVPGPGGGGRVWMGYAEYLKAFYEARWKRPTSLSRPVAFVGVQITVTKTGHLKEYRIIDPSGIAELDLSVEDVLRVHRRLDPLPAEFDGIERTFRIKFRLEGSTT
jgi:TonB family protein